MVQAGRPLDAVAVVIPPLDENVWHRLEAVQGGGRDEGSDCERLPHYHLEVARLPLRPLCYSYALVA